MSSNHKQSDRIGWIELLRAFAVLLVVVPHFIATFCPEVFVIWQTYSFVLKGISGKHGVAIFCVLIGFFSSPKKEVSFPTYLIRRYLQFAINICIVLLALIIVNSILFRIQFFGFVKGVVWTVIEAVLFKSSMNPTLWCVRSMFFGSLACFVLGNYCKMENKWKELAFVIVLSFFMYYIDVWIAISILGAGLRVFSEIMIANKLRWLLCAAFVVAIPLLYRHEESFKTYFMQGISCCFFMYVCMCLYSTKCMKRWPKCRLLTFIGNISFYMFLWHTPINMVLNTLDLGWNMWALFAVSFSCTIVLSIVQNWVNKRWIVPCYKGIRIDTV